jgi:hypothetical protein
LPFFLTHTWVSQELLVFEKAQRKHEEADFFVQQLRKEQGTDAVEFLFNALLNAGKNVVNSLRAQILYREAQAATLLVTAALPRQTSRVLGAILALLVRYRAQHAAKQTKKRARKAYHSHFVAWRRTLTPQEKDLFDVLQELRDIEVHAKVSGSRHIPKIVERRQPRPVPSDPNYSAVFANYMAIGMLSPEVTVGETTYSFQVDANVLSEPAMRVLFERFSGTTEKPTLEIGETYARLLRSLVDYFVAHYT